MEDLGPPVKKKMVVFTPVDSSLQQLLVFGARFRGRPDAGAVLEHTDCWTNGPAFMREGSTGRSWMKSGICILNPSSIGRPGVQMTGYIILSVVVYVLHIIYLFPTPIHRPE